MGARIWQLMQEDGDVQTVFDALLAEYDVDEEQLEKHLDELLKSLSEAGLICLEPMRPEEQPT